MMRKIHQLPADVITKIAAGEVIERPAFVVKELLENSIDAKGRNIFIFIEDSGLKKIAISDDGEGMNQADILECFKHHTTSKIFKDTDLQSIKSFGFRGEALSSIAAVSELMIKSRTRDESVGTQVTIKNGLLINSESIGMSSGTSIKVSKLFSNVPVRKKFLKSERVEFRHILDTILTTSLAYPQIRFSLTHNRKSIFDLPAFENLNLRLPLLLGDTISQQLISVKYENSYFKAHGFLAKPHLSTQTNQKQFIFVNKRKVSDPLIASAVKEGFGSLLSHNSYPIFVLFIELPFEFVDANIHPQKDQVNFADREFIFDSIKQAILSALIEHNLTFKNSSWSAQNGISTSDRLTNSIAGKLLKQEISEIEIANLGQIKLSTEPVQFHNLFIMTESPDGIVLTDQHAAHERILYEQFLANFLQQKSGLEIFSLSQPLLLDLSLFELEIIKEYQEVLTKLGFTIEQFNKSILTLTSIPQLFRDRDPLELIKELVEDLKVNDSIKEVDIKSQKMLAYLACRAAVKAGDSLTRVQCQELLTQLERTPNAATCPHGRPTKIILSLKDLHKMFKRS